MGINKRRRQSIIKTPDFKLIKLVRWIPGWSGDRVNRAKNLEFIAINGFATDGN